MSTPHEHHRQNASTTHMDPTLQRLHDRTAKIALIGQGEVDLPVARWASQVGFDDVIGFEVSPERVEALQTNNRFVGDVSDDELDAENIPRCPAFAGEIV